MKFTSYQPRRKSFYKRPQRVFQISAYLFLDDIFVPRVRFHELDLLLLLLCLGFVCALLFSQPVLDNGEKTDVVNGGDKHQPECTASRMQAEEKKKKRTAVMVTSVPRLGHLSSFFLMFHRLRGRGEIISHRMERHEPQ